ncbi:MAG: NUDIX hydrolase [Acidimicrobiales bacterium]
MSGLDPETLRSALDPHPPALDERGAAVAAVFRHEGGRAELLFIQRATFDGDPWSGQMAFPGGRIELHDSDRFAAAERETSEELSLDLMPDHRLGTVGTVEGGRHARRSIVVSGHGYWLEGDRPVLRPNREVAAALWVPVDVLLDRDRYIDYRYPTRGDSATFPGIQLDDPRQVIWGLTLRMLANLFDRLERPFLIRP